METNSVIVQALAAGAAAAFRPNLIPIPRSERPLDNAYDKLKETIREKYPEVDVDLLDIGPGSGERQQNLEAQLQTQGALEDETLQKLAQKLLAEIYEHEPEAATAVGLPPSPQQ